MDDDEFELLCSDKYLRQELIVEAKRARFMEKVLLEERDAKREIDFHSKKVTPVTKEQNDEL
jgi:hypothetical protein